MLPADEEQLPTEVHRLADLDEPMGEAVFVLTVARGAEQGQSFRLDGTQPTRVLVGSGPACDIRLTDREVSRRHAALERIGNELRLTDLGSTNGTFVDRVKIIVVDLQGGESIHLGATMLRVERETITTEAPLTKAVAFGRLIGSSQEMRRLYPLCERIAQAQVPVIIEGETGTGKEVLAEAIHEMGPRASGPFVVFDCTAVPANLLEAELFGHERGAFTGAVTMRAGVFEQAHGGTLLIDEIGDLELSLQPKLLRAIERSEVRRVGGNRWTHVDVRVLAATRRDLDREVQAGRFRDDLFHRLAVARIELPPLRHRRGDVIALALHFARQMGSDSRQLPRELLQKWDDYTWPGNIRELRNAVSRVVALGDLTMPEPSTAEVTTSSDRTVGEPEASALDARPAQASDTDSIDGWVARGLPFPQTRDRVLEELEQRYVSKILASHGGDVTKAAAASGIGRRYFQKLKARSGG